MWVAVMVEQGLRRLLRWAGLFPAGHSSLIVSRLLLHKPLSVRSGWKCHATRRSRKGTSWGCDGPGSPCWVNASARPGLLSGRREHIVPVPQVCSRCS